MYYVDTPTSVVVEYEYDKKTDSIANPRTVIRIPRELGYPDGMTIDRNGNLWIAHWGGSGVYCWNPATGNLLARVEVPAKKCNLLCLRRNKPRYLIHYHCPVREF